MKKAILFLLFAYPIIGAETWHGDHYHLTCRPQYEMARYVIEKFLTNEYQTILDIGCGSGEVTQEMSKNTQFTLGVDYSESMIACAKKSYSHIKNLAFQVADTRSLSHIKETFDLVTSFHTIQWIPSSDQNAAFSEMAKRLNSSGTCAVLVSDRFNIFYQPLMHVAQKEEWRGYFPPQLEPWNSQTVGLVSQSFEKAALRPLHVSVWYKQYRFNDEGSFRSFMANWFYSAAHFNYLPDDQREQFFNEVMEQFFNSISYQDGAVEFASPFVIGIAQKHE